MERGGEIPKPASDAAKSRTVSGALKGVALNTLGRQTSFTSSASSMRPPSVTSMRNVSNGSFSSSVSSGTRPPSSHSHRPQTAMGNSRIQKPVTNPARPSTAMETHIAGPGSKKRKGMSCFPLDVNGTPLRSTQMQRNGSYDPGMNYTSGWESTPETVRSVRNFSLSTAMSQMSLDDMGPRALSTAKPDLALTPSHIPRLAQSVAQRPETPSPSRSPKKIAQPLRFLTRESNTPVAWDTDSRLEEVETVCSQMKDQITGVTAESSSLRDMVNVYKARSRLTALLALTNYY